MSCPDYWYEAIAHLANRDQILEKLIDSYPESTLINHHNAFYTLTRAIVGQQISVKAAEAIWQRLALLLETCTPEAYLQLGEDQLRQCGLSRSKIEYIKNIAIAWQQGLLTPLAWNNGIT